MPVNAEKYFDLLFLSIPILIINLYQFLILCSSKVLLLGNNISLKPNIYLMSLVFSESDRLSFANGIDATHKGRTQYTTCTVLANTYISAIRTIFLGVVSIAQFVEVTDSAVLGGVAEVVSSSPTVGHKNIFQHLSA